MSAWTLRILPGTAATPTACPALDLDPRTRTLTLGLQRRSGGDAELWSGVLLRRHFPDAADPIDWKPTCDWLQTDAAAMLLDGISAGYSAELLWSGDWSARWTPEAHDAAHALLQHVQDLLTRQQT